MPVDGEELIQNLSDYSMFFLQKENDLLPGEYEILDQVEEYFSEGGDPNLLVKKIKKLKTKVTRRLFLPPPCISPKFT
jgi:hypothetical protein